MFFSKRGDNSVLNIDSFDKRRFNKILDSSSGLSEIVKTSKKKELLGVEPLLNDIWGSLYKMSPEIKEHVSSELETNKSLMERVMDGHDYEVNRGYTRLDELTSALGTVKFGKETTQWLVQKKEENEEIERLMNEIKEKKVGGIDPSDAINSLNQIMQKEIEKDSFLLRNKMNNSVKDANETKQNMFSLLGEAELERVPLKDQLKLAELLMDNKLVKEVAEWAGKFTLIARKKQKSRHTESILRSGVSIGSNIERLLPSELALYSNEKTKLDFMRRFVEGETLQYSQEGNEPLGKGPIIVCLDESGSMRKLMTQSKGFALALMSIAKKQRRDFCLIRFSSQGQKFTHLYPKGRINVKDMIELATSFIDGGTCFETPLKEALKVVNNSRFEKSDIVFITDGDSYLGDRTILNINTARKEKKLNVFSLVISSNTRANSIEACSDKVARIENFESDFAYEVFEI